jgi:hypothetical protein
MIARDSCSSVLLPNIMVPRQSGLALRPELPSLRFSVSEIFMVMLNYLRNSDETMDDHCAFLMTFGFLFSVGLESTKCVRIHLRI